MRLAAIDIGTNSLHMIVVNVRPDLSFEVIDREKEMVRLGAGGLDGRALTPEAMHAALQVLSKFRQQNFRIAVDDVGTGYSNLTSLAEIEPDYLKFDNVFVRGIDRRRTKQDLLEALMSFARKMKTKVIAEGIETREELKVLQSLGVPYGQGFLLARPMPGSEIEKVQPFRF